MVPGHVSGTEWLRHRNQPRSGWTAAGPAGRTLSAWLWATSTRLPAALSAALLRSLPALLRPLLRSQPLLAPRRLLRLAPALVAHDPEKPRPGHDPGWPAAFGKTMLREIPVASPLLAAEMYGRTRCNEAQCDDQEDAADAGCGGDQARRERHRHLTDPVAGVAKRHDGAHGCRSGEVDDVGKAQRRRDAERDAGENHRCEQHRKVDRQGETDEADRRPHHARKRESTPADEGDDPHIAHTGDQRGG